MPAGRRWVGVLALALVAAGFAAASPRSDPPARADAPWFGPAGRMTGAGAAPPAPAEPSATPASPGAAGPAAAPCQPAALEERAGRVLLVGLPEVTSPDDPLLPEVADVGVSGVLLTHTNVVTEGQVKTLVSAVKRAARGRLLVAVDEEPGRVRTFEDLFGFVPSARRLASERTPAQVRDLGRETGRFLSELGVDVNLAPVADLDGGPSENTIGDRSFSADPATAAGYALAYARGLRDAGVTPVVKHFPGRSGASGDDHFGDSVATTPLPDLVRSDLAPFRELVGAGAPVVMMGNVVFESLDPDAPASMSAAAYGMLRDIGFEGVALTDSIGMGAVNLRWDYGEATVRAVEAGADGVLATDGWGARWMRDALVEAVRSGRLSEARLNDAAARMTALAGGEPEALTCQAADLPELR